jgi:hypothetical protein
MYARCRTGSSQLVYLTSTRTNNTVRLRTAHQLILSVIHLMLDLVRKPYVRNLHKTSCVETRE